MKIAGFYKESITNGFGIRCVLFVSGCPHKCSGCHNPETHDPEYGIDFSECKKGILRYIDENKYALRGITLSGGEPFLYSQDLVPFVKEVRAMGLDVWAYTGFDIEDLASDTGKLPLLSLVDVLIDGKFDVTKKDHNILFRGSANQRVIYVPTYLDTLNVDDSLLKLEGRDLI